MEKRLVLAIGLSMLVLLAWSALSPKPQIVGNTLVTSNSSSLTSISQSTGPVLVPQTLISANDNVAVETVKFIQDSREIVFDLSKAAIIEVIFKNGPEHRLPLKLGFVTDDNLIFKQAGRTADSISFVAEGRDRRVIKKFTIPKDSYAIDLRVETYNASPSLLTLYPQIILGRLDLSSKNSQARFQDIFVGAEGKNKPLSANKEFTGTPSKFISLRDQYFCAIMEPVDLLSSAYLKKISSSETELGLVLNKTEVSPKSQIGHSYRIYVGPQDLKLLNSIKPEWTAIIYYGMFDFIAQLMLQLLGFFYSLVHNWGLAIIILSVSVYFILFPLSIKQMRSMKEMQLLQPKIEALRKELKDNPQKLNKEIMELYKEHKVNPLGGCLPLLLQMPIFFALYQALIRSVALRGAHFLWIKDLSAPDKAFVFKNSIPLLGNQLNILPILMAIGMFVQQKVSMAKATTGESAQQQKMMMVIMPIMFGVIFYQMPSGLVLYWFVNSLLMLAYQFKINQQK